MSTQPNYLFTIEQYIAVLKTLDCPPLEYWDGHLIMMGGSKQHAAITGNVVQSISRALPRGACKVYGDGQGVYAPPLDPFRIPDCTVVCGEVVFKTINGIGIIVNPTLIVEVLSPTSAIIDCTTKFEAYKMIASFREYLLVAQDAPRVTQWVKYDNWAQCVHGEGDAIYLDSIGCELELAEFYDDVKF